jgi:hypothetical protein
VTEAGKLIQVAVVSVCWCEAVSPTCSVCHLSVLSEDGAPGL